MRCSRQLISIFLTSNTWCYNLDVMRCTQTASSMSEREWKMVINRLLTAWTCTRSFLVMCLLGCSDEWNSLEPTRGAHGEKSMARPPNNAQEEREFARDSIQRDWKSSGTFCFMEHLHRPHSSDLKNHHLIQSCGMRDDVLVCTCPWKFTSENVKHLKH